MNQRTQTIAAPATLGGSRDLATAIRNAFRRAAAWLYARRAPDVHPHEAFLNHAVDFCDLEWRMREIDRQWGRSGSRIGGARF